MSDAVRADLLDQLNDLAGALDTGALGSLVEMLKGCAGVLSANDPDARIQGEETALAAWRSFTTAMLGYVFARRYGAAMVAFGPADPRGVNVEAAKRGRTAFVRSRAEDDPDYAVAHRRGIARGILDFADLFAPGAAEECAAGFWLLNLGEGEFPLMKRYRIAGAHAADPFIYAVNFGLLGRVYYHAGFHDIKLLSEAASEVVTDDSDEKQWGSLERFRERHPEMIGALHFTREQGQHDRKEGRPYSSPFTIDYDMVQAEKAGVLKRLTRQK